MPAIRSQATVWTAIMAFCAGALVAALCFTMSGAGGMPPMAGMNDPEGSAPMVPPAYVRFGTVKAQPLRQRIAVVGRLEEVRRTTVAAEVAGKVLDVPVEEGDSVKAGQTVLAKIDDAWATQNLKRAEAEVAAAQATLSQSELELKYLEQLLAAQSAKPKEVDDMRARVASDRARLAAAIAERDRARLEVERLVVLAPFDGVVTRKIAEAGQWVSPGEDVVELISTGEIDAVADVPERKIDRIRVGDLARVHIDPLDRWIEGPIVSINPNGLNNARTFRVKVRLDDLAGQLKPGMSVTAWLAVGPESDHLTVPQDAVYYTPDGTQVWVALPGSDGPPMPSAMFVPVRTLFTVGDRVVVEPVSKDSAALLADGAQVVVEGMEDLFPGRPLIDADAQPMHTAPPGMADTEPENESAPPTSP
ncbi:MAG: efflux RND transporter periplasmic adaptor subunit [Phycisphaeraceae bacterium]